MRLVAGVASEIICSSTTNGGWSRNSNSPARANSAQQALFKPIINMSGRPVTDVIVKFIVGAGKATPSPPIGPALGSKGIKSIDFCKVRRHLLNRLENHWKEPKLTASLDVQCSNHQLYPRHPSAMPSHDPARPNIQLRHPHSANIMAYPQCGQDCTWVKGQAKRCQQAWP